MKEGEGWGGWKSLCSPGVWGTRWSELRFETARTPNQTPPFRYDEGAEWIISAQGVSRKKARNP